MECGPLQHQDDHQVPFSFLPSDSYFCTHLSMRNRHLVMDGSSSAETTFQQNWAHDLLVSDLTICHVPQSGGSPEQITWLGHEGFSFTKSKGFEHFYPPESLRCLFRHLFSHLYSNQLLQVCAQFDPCNISRMQPQDCIVFNPKFSHSSNSHTPWSGFM